MKRILSFVMAFALMLTNFSNVAFAAESVNITVTERPADGITKDQPFASGTGGSTNFRIPCLVSLDDGTIVAACDARWNHSSDAAGLDTIVSHSKDNGATWHYTFANYLGDNGNVFNNMSTAIIDPAIATDGKTIYLVADLYPAGYAINSARYIAADGQNGLTADGKLRLASAEGVDTNNDGHISRDERIAGTCNYDAYVLVKASEDVEDDAEEYYIIQDAQGNKVEGYSVDAYFNIKGNGVDTNLFFENSPFLTFPTDYLYLTKSTDGGATWSVPTFINTKLEHEQCLLVGPGNGIVTSTGRIIFTVYEFTYTDKNSAAIYSDDGGVTWHRGDSVSAWSSEATVAEVDNKLYMFTRHGNAYYVSDDWGETWGPQIHTGLSYNSNCQLSVISYSKKIDGKSAVLFSVPSSTEGRKAGKIHVGLIQDDGSIKWPYEYSVNGDDYYAYSCIEELQDGSIGLLYESAGARITYTNIPIRDIVKEAVISDFWLTDDQDNITNELNLKNNDSVQLNVKGQIAEGSEITASSSHSEYLTAEIEGDKLTIQAHEVAEGSVVRAKITVTDGNNTVVLPVAVAADEKYQLINLRVGETLKITDITGDYSDEELGAIENYVSVSVNKVAAEQKIQLASGAGSFTGGEEKPISSSLFTFTPSGEATETTKTFVVSGKSGDTTVYFWPGNGSGIASDTNNQGAVTFEEYGNTDTFTIKSTEHYLFFYNGTREIKYRFDRNSVLPGENELKCCLFEIYKVEASEGSAINGYTKITDINQLTEGQYLIANTDKDHPEDYYFLYPYNGGNDPYKHVAKYMPAAVIPARTDITFKGLEEGEAGIKIGDTAYYISVEYKKEDVNIKVGQEVGMPGEPVWEEENQDVVKLELATDLGPRVPVAEIQEGTYVFGKDSHIMINESHTGYNGTGLRLKAMALNQTEERYGDYLWTLKKVEGVENGYTMQDISGKYVNLSNGLVELTITPQTLTIYRDNGKIQVKNGNAYFNNFGGNGVNELISGYSGNTENWQFYTTVEGYVMQGLKAGTTEMVFDDTKYTINVEDIRITLDKDNGEEAVIQTVTYDGFVVEPETPVKEGYIFEGWYDKEIQQPFDFGTKIREDFQLIAKWEKKSEGSMVVLEEAIASAKALKAEDYSPESYAAVMEALAAAEIIKAKENVTKEEVDNAINTLNEAISKLAETDTEEPGGTEEPDDNEEPTPGVSGNYTVSFNSNGGNEVETQTVSANGYLAEVTVPVREGYTFLGWYSEDGKLFDLTKDAVTGNITLTARWLLQGEIKDEDVQEVVDKLEKEENKEEVVDKIWVAGVKNLTYTGGKQTFPIRVYDGNKLLEEKVDYTISFKNNQNAKTFSDTELEDLLKNAEGKDDAAKSAKKVLNTLPQLVIKMKGQYKGTRSVYFNIEPISIEESNEDISIDNLFVKVTNKPQKVKPVVLWRGKKLGTKDFKAEAAAGSDLTNVTGDKPIQITVTGQGNFTGTRTITMTIFDKSNTIDMSKVKVTLPNKGKVTWNESMKDGYTYPVSGNGIIVKNGKIDVSEDSYQLYGYENNNQVGTATLLLKGNEEKGYFGIKRVTFKIEGISLTNLEASGLKKDYPYTGAEIKPLKDDVTLKIGDKILDSNDYTVEYSKNIAKGKSTITVTGNPKEGYTGTKKFTFNIKVAEINDQAVGFVDENTVEIVKGGVKPAVLIKNKAGMILKEGKDYSVTYKNNKKVGEATAVVKGKGNYSGTKELPFAIAKKSISSNDLTLEVKDKVVSTAETTKWSQSFKIYDKDGKALKAGADYNKTVTYKLLKADGTVERELKTGDSVSVNSVIRIVVKGEGDYNSDVEAVKTSTYRLISKTQDISKVKIKIDSKVYTGKAVTLEKEDIKFPSGNSLILGTDFEIVKYENNMKKGTAKVTFKGIGNYGGSQTVTFKIDSRSVGTEADNWWSNFVNRIL